MYNKEKNKGLSLVELIVVIAIMGIMIGILGVSVAYISRQRVVNAAKDVKQEIQLARAYARSKGFCKLSIKGQSDSSPAETINNYVYVYTASNQADLSDPSKCRYGDGPAEIYKNKITTKVYYEDGNIVTVKRAVDFCDICFNRTMGGYVTSSYNGLNQYGIDVTGSSVPTKIEFTNGEKVCTIVLAKYTGTATIE